MKLKIISDGTLMGTKIVNADTGEAVENVTALDLNVTAHGLLCKLEIFGSAVDLVAEFKEQRR